MCARFTMRSDTPITAAIKGCEFKPGCTVVWQTLSGRCYLRECGRYAMERRRRHAQNPAARPGFALRKTKSDEVLDLIFRDDRCRTGKVELITEADLDLVLRELPATDAEV